MNSFSQVVPGEFMITAKLAGRVYDYSQVGELCKLISD
jgi:hypothetical protein